MPNRILIVEDDVSLREALYETLCLAGFETETATDGYNALNNINQKNFDMVISDVAMKGMDGHQLLKELTKLHPELPVLLMTAYADIASAIQAIRDGAIDYLVKPFEPKQLISVVRHVIGDVCREENAFVAESPASKLLFSQAKKVAQTDATVLISGESGTGKEVVARYIHQSSRRHSKPFIAINCAAIPENMLEATLFGYEKGAFTGAYQANPGKFEQAQYGTLLLDEITEMDLALQAKLLRVLQEREIERLGGKKIFQLDVRVLATSNRNLKIAVKEGHFREDLYYRLNVFPIKTLPLRQRPEDIAPLCQHMLQHHAEKMRCPQRVFSVSALTKLRDYNWPGNVRELDNVVQRALILSTSPCIEAEDIQFEVHVDTESSVFGSAKSDPPAIEVASEDNLKQREYSAILQELLLQKGCRTSTAKKLGISARTLRYKLAKMRAAGMQIPDVKNTETDMSTE